MKTLPLSISTWNVNGLRACERNGFLQWFAREQADVVCLQEVKATQEQLGEALLHPLGYHGFLHAAQKPGYSGVLTYTRQEPTDVFWGIGIPEIDCEGRVLRVDFGNLSIINVYFPNSQRDHSRLGYKLMFCRAIHAEVDRLRAQGRHIVLCGDYNIAHRPIDLRNPKANENNAGFLPEERAWMDQFLRAGYVDAFRVFEPGGGHYTWWSYRPGVRERNIGWRLDYHVVNEEMKERLKASVIEAQVLGSDHCPVRLELYR